MLTAGQVAHKLIGKAGRREGGGGADPQSGVGGHGSGGGLARRGGLVRCRGRVCWANAEMGAQCAGCLCKAGAGSFGRGACWAGERLRRAVRGRVGRELRYDVECGLWRSSAGCRGGGVRASCAMGLRNFSVDPENVHGGPRRGPGGVHSRKVMRYTQELSSMGAISALLPKCFPPGQHAQDMGHARWPLGSEVPRCIRMTCRMA